MLEDVKHARKGEPVTTKIRRINRKRTSLIAGLIFLLVGGVGASFVSFNSKSVSVGFELPNVVGLSEQDARALLNGFTVTVQRAPDAHIPKDRIASQLPLPASKVQKGSAVTLTISDGAGDTVVPVDLVGKSLEEARISLAAAGLVISRTQPIDSNQAPGMILQSDPVPGTTVAAGSGVILQISSGQVQVPQLLGLSEIEAQTVLTQGGFLSRIIYAYQADKPIDTVLAQAPDAGTSANIGSIITLTVNKNS